MIALQIGPPYTLADGTAYAIPPSGCLLTWQNMGASCDLLGSNDGTNYAALDTSAVQYEVQSISTGTVFIKPSGAAAIVTIRQ